jgi:hypothetical protein
MQKKLLVLSGLFAVVAWLCVACSSFQKEFSVAPGSTNGPPISQQLQTAATITGAVVPEPWGVMVSTALATLGSIAAAVAALHAKNAAVASNGNPFAATAPVPNPAPPVAPKI